MKKMIKKLTAGILTAVMLFSGTVFAEDMPMPEEPTESASETAEAEAETIEIKVPTAAEAYKLKTAIAGLSMRLAETYYYGVEDEDLLYRALSSAISKGYFDFDAAVENMMKALKDGYSEYYSPERYESLYTSIQGEYYGLGVTIMLSGNHVVITGIFPNSPADKSGLKLYDTIVSIDGKSTEGLSAADVASLIKREKGTAVNVGVKRGDETLTVTAYCDEVDQNPVSYEIWDGNIGYIYISSFTANLDEFVSPILAEFDEKGIKDVILDIRNNGGGELNAAIALASHFIPEGVVTKLKYKNPELNEDLTVTNGMTKPKYNLVLLVNENSASASELFSGAVKARKAGTIIGTKTFGKGSMQSVFRLQSGCGIKYTIAEFYSPADERIHTVGITPDYVVENPTYPVDENKFEKIDLDKPNDTTPGKHVMAVEQRLGALGFMESEPDENFDEETENAVKQFQALSGMDITGETDLYTLIAISDYVYDFNITEDVQIEAAEKFIKTGKID